METALPVPARPVLPWLAFALVAGAAAPGAPAVLAGTWGIPAPGVGVLLIVAVLIAGTAACLPESRWPWLRRWLLAVAGLGLGCGLAGPVGDRSPAPRLASVDGTVVSVAYTGWSQGVRLGDLDGDLHRARLFVKLPPVPGVAVGDRLRVRGVWSREERGERLDAVEVERLVACAEGPRGWAWRVIDRVGAHRELAATLLLGNGRPPERDDFRIAGLAHVLAVSGLHLGIAAALAWWLMRRAGLPWWSRVSALGVLILGYVWLTGGAPGTQRAAAMSLAVVVADLLGREPHRLSLLGLAAVVLVLVDPATAGQLSFQLSFLAVLGILTLGRDLVDLRRRWLPLTPWNLDRPSWRGVLFLTRAGIDGLAIGIAATLATVPVIATVFHTATLWSPVSTLLVAMPVAAVLWLGLPMLLLGGLWPEGPWAGLHALVDADLDLLSRLAAWAARWPGATLVVAAPPAWVCLAWPLLAVRQPWAWDLAGRTGLLAVLIISWMIV